MTTLNFEEDQVQDIAAEMQALPVYSGGKRKWDDEQRNTLNLAEDSSCNDSPLSMMSNNCGQNELVDDDPLGPVSCPITGMNNSAGAAFHSFPSSPIDYQCMSLVGLPTPSGETDRLLDSLVKQTHENTVLLREMLAELQELKEQMQRKFPFTVKTCGFERELVTRAKELFINNGPWLVQGAVEKLKEKITELLGGVGKADTYHINACVSYCKEKFTLWRAEIRKKVLNKKFNRLRISEFTEKLYTPFKNKEEDMKNATKTTMLLRRFAVEQNYLTQTSKPDFWENFVECVNTWNNLNAPHKWTTLRQEDEATYKESLFHA